MESTMKKLSRIIRRRRRPRQTDPRPVRSTLAAALACLLLAALIPAPALAANAQAPTADAANSRIFANGLELRLRAGSTAGETTYTIVEYRTMGSGGGYTSLTIEGFGAPAGAADTGYDLSNWEIYGGSDSSDLEGSTSVTMNGGQVKNIYGGGHGNSANANVSGSTSIIISDAATGTVYGGGYGSWTAEAGVGGNTMVSITGSAVTGSVYGGGYGRVAGNTEVTVAGSTVSLGVHGGNAGSDSKVEGNTKVTVAAGSTANYVYGGGSNASSVDGNTETLISGTVTTDVCGGGQGGSVGTAGKNNTVKVTIAAGGRVGGSVYGGTSGSGSGVVYGDTEVTVRNGAQVDESVFGGIDKISGKSTVHIGGTVVESVYGGTDGAKIGGDSVVIVENGGVVTQNVYGGSRSYGKVGGSSMVTVENGGKVTQDVYGGNYSGTVSGSSIVTVKNGAQVAGSIYGGNDYGGTVVGDTAVTVGGEVKGSVYGGGAGVPLSGQSTVVGRNTKVTIESGASVKGSVYGGVSVQGSSVEGNTEVIVKEGGTVSENVYGGSYDGEVKGSAAVTVGGTVIQNVYGGGNDNAAVDGGKSVTVTGAARIGGTAGGEHYGVVLTGSSVTNGVASFSIDSAGHLIHGSSVHVFLPSDRKTAGDANILATGADEGDARYIHTGEPNLKAIYRDADHTIVLADGPDNPEPPAVITLHPNGGTVTPASITIGPDDNFMLSSLPTPTRSGSYRFEGWFTEAAGGTAVTTDTAFYADADFFAHWEYTGSGSGNPGSGGGSGGGSSAGTTTNPDGSITTTITDKITGTITETTKFKDGTQIVVETKKDGSKKETVTTPDGTKAETVTTAQGDKTYTERRADGTKISADVPKSGAAAATVDLPRGVSAPATVSFPVIDGTVALQVLSDGTAEPIVYSLVADGKVYVRLDGDARLQVETRRGLFDDMNSHWAKEYADFTGARGLFKGTAPRTFSPEQPMTRAMLVTVLCHMAGTPDAGDVGFRDVANEAWYANGVAWAAKNGIAAGTGHGIFDADRAVTRQELAVMLQNYAKYEGIDVSAGEDTSILSYPDIQEASQWAVPALEWACGAGILRGNTDGTLDPAGLATRAQVAVMLEHFVTAAVK